MVVKPARILAFLLIFSALTGSPASACDEDSSETPGSRALSEAFRQRGLAAEASSPLSKASANERAREAFLKSAHLILNELEMAPNNPVHYARLAVVYRGLGMFERARGCVLLGLEQCPDNQTLLSLL